MKKCIKFLAFVLTLIIFVPMSAAADEDSVTRIILVRHGETSFNKAGRFQGWADIPLNETGIKQAELLAQGLKDVPIDVFISSPLQRAYLTTLKVAELHGKEIEYTDPRLREINFGDWSKQRLTDLKSKYPEKFDMWIKKPWLVIHTNGESLQDVQDRSRAALNDIVARYPSKTVFVGAHSHLNAALLCSVLEVDLDHFRKFAQSNTCVNVLEYKNGTWKALLINSTAHLNRLF